MDLKYDATELRLFIDSSSRSLKAVLLHNGKVLSIPVEHSLQMKETHNSMDHLLSAVNYQKHKWLICRDLKVVGPVLGLQGEYTKYPCFLLLWDSLADDQYYVRQEWPLGQELKPGSHRVQSHPLDEPNKILLPPLHIKLEVMKNFVKAMDREGSGFAFLQEKFLRISMEKLEAGIFDERTQCLLSKAELSKAELSPWQLLKSLLTNFLWNHRSADTTKILMSYWRVSAISRHECQSNCTFCGNSWTDFQRTVRIWMKNQVSAFTKIFALWRSATKAGGM